MAKGGARPGAGRPKGVPNKASTQREAEVAASGLTPLEYMLELLRNDQAAAEDRKWAAQQAAPYVHPKRAPVDSDGTTQPGAVIYIETGRAVPRAD